MKIKEVIAQTDLTDRAIRLYIENGLVSPSFNENYKGRKNIDFSQEDVENLKNIATLRKAGFSIAEIKLIKDGGDECRRTLSEFITKTAERIEADKEIINSLQAIVKEDDLSIEAICNSLNTPTTKKNMPSEDMKLTLLEKVEKTIILLLASTALLITVGYCVLIALYYNHEFKYIKVYSPVTVSVAMIFIISLIAFFSLQIYSQIKSKRVVVKHHGIKSVIKSLVIVAVIASLLPLSFLPAFAPLVYSQTEDPDNYMQIDHGVVYFIEDIYSLFPVKIPDSQRYKYGYFSSEYADTVKYFYRYNCVIENDFDIVAEWKLTDEEFEAEKQRAYNDVGKTTYETSKNDWKCLYYGDFDETQRESYYFKIFAYNEQTKTVRYIISYSIEKCDPYFLSLDW